MKTIRQFEPWFGEEEKEEVAKAIDSTWVTEAGRTRELEKIFAEFVGAKYASATNSGSMALAVALMAVGVTYGDEVIVPDLTFVATANAARLLGAKPVLVDIKPEDLTIDPERVEENITDKTKAIVPVHSNGRPADMESIKEIAEDHGLFVVEDCAQALSSRLHGQCLGTFGNIGCFSLTTTKIITTGQGGMVVTNDPKLSEKVRRLKDHGRLDKSDHHPGFGFNFKFTDLQAALGLAQWRKLDYRIGRIKQIYSIYRDSLSPVEEIAFLKMDLTDTTPWYVDIHLDKQLELKSYLEKRNIETRPLYLPLHMQPCYKVQGDFRNAEYASTRGLFLPSSTFLADEDIARICSEIKAFFRRF